MRPVQLPAAPANYPQAGLWTQLYRVRSGPNQVADRPISTVAGDLRDLIDRWSANQFRMVGRLRLLDPDAPINAAMNAAFDSWWGAVSADGDYGGARLDLITALGAYCNYCELPTSAALAVEHRLPKAKFPASFLNWPNFLLACPICNSVKGDTPYQKIDGHDYSTAQAIPLLEQGIAWPQAYWQNYANGALLPFTYTLRHLTPGRGKWVVGPPVTGTDLDTVLRWFQEGRGGVQNNAYGLLFDPPPVASPSRGRFFYYGVMVEARGPTAPTIQRLIELTRLNRVNRMSDQASTDFRVALRTQAYLRAMTVRRHVGDLIAQNADTPATLDLVLNTARQTGFWGVWLTVFRDLPDMLQAINEAYPGFVAQGWTI